MAKHLFRHLSLFYNGDWHTQLLASLKLAKEDTRRGEVRAAIEALEAQLAATDECIHTVTVIRQVPDGLDANAVMNHVQEQIRGEQASAEFKSPAAIELTLTARGSHSHVSFVANSYLASGINTAKATMWVRLQFGGKD